MLNEEFRYGTKRRRFTKWQRLRIWFSGIIEAIKAAPDKEWVDWILLKPGDHGYDDAPFGAIVTPSPLRYKFENGEWVEVDPNKEPKLVNPDWHDATP